MWMAFMAMLTEGIQQKKGTGCRWWWDMYMIANVIINWIKQKKTESKNNKVKCNVMIAQAIFVNEWMNEWNSMTKMIKIFFFNKFHWWWWWFGWLLFLGRKRVKEKKEEILSFSSLSLHIYFLKSANLQTKIFI